MNIECKDKCKFWNQDGRKCQHPKVTEVADTGRLIHQLRVQPLQQEGSNEKTEEIAKLRRIFESAKKSIPFEIYWQKPKDKPEVAICTQGTKSMRDCRGFRSQHWWKFW